MGPPLGHMFYICLNKESMKKYSSLKRQQKWASSGGRGGGGGHMFYKGLYREI